MPVSGNVTGKASLESAVKTAVVKAIGPDNTTRPVVLEIAPSSGAYTLSILPVAVGSVQVYRRKRGPKVFRLGGRGWGVKTARIGKVKTADSIDRIKAEDVAFYAKHDGYQSEETGSRLQYFLVTKDQTGTNIPPMIVVDKVSASRRGLSIQRFALLVSDLKTAFTSAKVYTDHQELIDTYTKVAIECGYTDCAVEIAESAVSAPIIA